MSGKKVVLLAVVVFLGFWMFTDPNGMALATKSGAGQSWTAAEQLFRAVIDFVNALD